MIGKVCPGCDKTGRPQEIAVTVTRWTSAGCETTLRCPVCGWQEVVRSGRAA